MQPYVRPKPFGLSDALALAEAVFGQPAATTPRARIDRLGARTVTIVHKRAFGRDAIRTINVDERGRKVGA